MVVWIVPPATNWMGSPFTAKYTVFSESPIAQPQTIRGLRPAVDCKAEFFSNWGKASRASVNKAAKPNNSKKTGLGYRKAAQKDAAAQKVVKYESVYSLQYSSTISQAQNCPHTLSLPFDRI